MYVVESWLCSDIYDSEISLVDYSIVRLDRRHHGGGSGGGSSGGGSGGGSGVGSCGGSGESHLHLVQLFGFTPTIHGCYVAKVIFPLIPAGFSCKSVWQYDWSGHDFSWFYISYPANYTNVIVSNSVVQNLILSAYDAKLTVKCMDIILLYSCIRPNNSMCVGENVNLCG